MPTLEATSPNVIDFNHLVPPFVPEVEEEFADPLTPEEEQKVRLAEEEFARGEYYTWDGDVETIEEFFARIDADPIGTMACNNGDWERDKQLRKAMEVYEGEL